MHRVGFGGGCHWCTEAVFEAIEGVLKVEQGWIASFFKEAQTFSEGVLVIYDEAQVSLEELVYVHLLTHNATSGHSMRVKYRSAVYVERYCDVETLQKILQKLQSRFQEKIVTNVYPILAFKKNEERYLHYFLKNSHKPFCKTHIAPKLRLVQKELAMKPLFSQLADRSAK